MRDKINCFARLLGFAGDVHLPIDFGEDVDHVTHITGVGALAGDAQDVAALAHLGDTQAIDNIAGDNIHRLTLEDQPLTGSTPGDGNQHADPAETQHLTTLPFTEYATGKI